jgi:hypothetical protein
MGRDNQPKHRQLARRTHKGSARSPYKRILIVTEGSKSEPNYLGELCSRLRLNSANVAVLNGVLGTAPTQVVEFARRLVLEGDLNRGIRPKAFDEVYVVIDRDAHESYHAALSMAAQLDGRFRSDDGEPISVRIIASVPCFELWLLLHFEDVLAPVTTAEAIARLEAHVPSYAKGRHRLFDELEDRLPVARDRAAALAAQYSPFTEPHPYTGIHELITLLMGLRS